MNRLFLLTTILLLAVCACTPTREFSNIDAEFGQATRVALDSQVANPDAAGDTQVPEGIEGINAEEMMSAYTGTFTKPPEKANIFSLGFTGFSD